jgi:hypothetical protein
MACVSKAFRQAVNTCKPQAFTLTDARKDISLLQHLLCTNRADRLKHVTTRLGIYFWNDEGHEGHRHAVGRIMAVLGCFRLQTLHLVPSAKLPCSITETALLEVLPVSLEELTVYIVRGLLSNLSRFKHMKRLEQWNYRDLQIQTVRHFPPALETLFIGQLPSAEVQLPQTLSSVRLGVVFGLDELHRVLALPALRRLCIYMLVNRPDMHTIRLPPLDHFELDITEDASLQLDVSAVKYYRIGQYAQCAVVES